MIYNYRDGFLYYKIKGAGNKMALIFFHGVAMDHKTFDAQVAELQDDYKLIIVDLPNHGKSSHFKGSQNYSRMCAEIAVGLLNHLEIDKAIFVGQSLGSFIVSQAAYLYPEKVMATVHIGGGGLYPKSSILLKAMIPMISPFIMLIPSKMMFRTFAKHKALQTHTREYMVETTTETGKRVIIDMTKYMIRDMVDGISAPIEQPTLITYGDHEASFAKKMNIKFDDTLPDSRIIIIKNAHHIANQDNPETFNKELKSFVESVDR